MDRRGQTWEISWNKVSCLYLVIRSWEDGSHDILCLESNAEVETVFEPKLASGVEGMARWRRIA